MSDAAFLAGLKTNPQDQLSWKVYADWLEEAGRENERYLLQTIGSMLGNAYGDITPEFRATLTADHLPEKLAALGRDLPDEAKGAAITALRETFKLEELVRNEVYKTVGEKNRAYADYLLLAGAVTGVEHTRLQGVYLLNDMEGESQKNITVLGQIREETRRIFDLPKVAGLMERLDISATCGLIRFNLSQFPITSIPPYFHGGVGTSFYGCENLRSVGAYFHAAGSVGFSGCRALEKIGPHFHTGRDLAIERCNALRELDKKTTIGEDLWARESGLRAFPRDMKLGRHINNIPDTVPDSELSANLYPLFSQQSKEHLRLVLGARRDRDNRLAGV